MHFTYFIKVSHLKSKVTLSFLLKLQSTWRLAYKVTSCKNDFHLFYKSGSHKIILFVKVSLRV